MVVGRYVFVTRDGMLKLYRYFFVHRISIGIINKINLYIYNARVNKHIYQQRNIYYSPTIAWSKQWARNKRSNSDKNAG